MIITFPVTQVSFYFQHPLENYTLVILIKVTSLLEVSCWLQSRVMRLGNLALPGREVLNYCIIDDVHERVCDIRSNWTPFLTGLQLENCLYCSGMLSFKDEEDKKSTPFLQHNPYFDSRFSVIGKKHRISSHIPHMISDILSTLFDRSSIICLDSFAEKHVAASLVKSLDSQHSFSRGEFTLIVSSLKLL